MVVVVVTEMGGTLMSVAVALAVVTEVGCGAVRCGGGDGIP